MCVNVFSLLFSFTGYHNDVKLNIDFAVTMLGMKSVEQLTEAKLVKEVMYFLEIKGSLPCSQYPFTGPDSRPNKSSPQLRILFLGSSFILFLYLQQLLPSGLIHSFFYDCSTVYISSPSYACHIKCFKFYKHSLIKHF